MPRKFGGKNGKQQVASALRQQRSLLCNESAISALAAASKVKRYRTSDALMFQGNDDDSIAFILQGEVEVQVNGRRVARRVGGQHVGEMSLIDPTARRSASVVAIAPTTVAWVQESAYTKVAEKHPSLWRALAVELADRLRQRSSLIVAPNQLPHIFIGSSGESVAIATKLKSLFQKDTFEVCVWTQGVFGLSDSAMESLETEASIADFAILLFTADDILRTRGRAYAAPRDNVVFELGLFMGAIKRKRTFMVVEEKQSMRFPSDLNGITYASFSRSNLGSSLGQVVRTIQERILREGQR